MPSSIEHLEQEKRRGDASTWQLSLETRSGALASIQSFITSCADMFVSQSDQQVSIPFILFIKVFFLKHYRPKRDSYLN